MTPKEYLAKFGHAAAAVEARYGVPAVVALAQSALESGWGRNIPGNNFFGIRAGKSWTGPVVGITTQEVVNGQRQVQHGQAFRAYATPEDSFLDWGRLLTTASRYAPCLEHKADPFAFAQALQNVGYSSDNTTTDGSPTYAQTLSAVIRTVQRAQVQG